MAALSSDKIREVLQNHSLYLSGKGGARAYLSGANLYGANLSGANLSDADLRSADLYGANLSGADLRGADLRNADLSGADLSGADLYGANLRGADLRDADLSGADLRGAYLRGAYLRGANLYGANLPRFQIPQEGSMIVWKKLAGNVIAKLMVPADAKRTATPIGRKCRAEYVQVLELTCGANSGTSCHDNETVYKVGEIVRPDSYNDDIRVECTNGIHFFLTREEAEEY